MTLQTKRAVLYTKHCVRLDWSQMCLGTTLQVEGPQTFLGATLGKKGERAYMYCLVPVALGAGTGAQSRGRVPWRALLHRITRVILGTNVPR